MRYFIVSNIIFLFFLNAVAQSQEKKVSDEKSTLFPINFYQKYISKTDGDRCQMHPTCSGYSKEVFKKHGLVVGFIMTCDRLLRCGRDELNLSEKVWSNEEKRIRCYDPVSNNDFWWKK